MKSSSTFASAFFLLGSAAFAQPAFTNATPRADDVRAIAPAIPANIISSSPALPAATLSIDQAAEKIARSDARWRKQWMISLAPLAASQSLDAASSYGMRELNPVLASANGGFGGKAVAIKFGTMGGLIAAEVLVVRKHPHSAKVFTLLNWSAAGLTAGFAAHNFNLQ